MQHSMWACDARTRELWLIHILFYTIFFFNEFWSRLKNKMNIEPDVVVYALDAIGSILGRADSKILILNPAFTTDRQQSLQPKKKKR